MSEWLDGECPTDAALDRIRTWDWHDFRALMEFVRSIWWMPDWGWDETQDGDAMTYEISTAGWSGNEEAIEALHANTMFWMMCWVSSRRGGHYEFEVKPIKDAKA